ncbi:copper amine oxidase N-terminal domain-containing protein [Paenibacillus sp. FSL L8-0638]|uniref:copper amine oxidase N-terminal domain-containing protein n=1 Tax=Paenibacillus TaxID=44249 RepID=UPI0031595376
MNFKKWTMLTALAVAQVAAVAPVGAEAASTTIQSTDSVSAQQAQTNVADSSVQNSIGAQEGTGTQNNTVTPDNTGVTNDPLTGLPTDTTNGSNVSNDVYGGDGTITNPGGAPTNMGANQLILYLNSAKMEQNGQVYTATQPMTVKDGVSYVAIRSLVSRVGLQFSYDTATKETVITQGTNVMRFKTDSKVYTVNGEARQMKGPAFQQKNVFMVPLTSITQALNIPYTVNNTTKQVIMDLNQKPKASFTVQQKDIYAGETQVTYLTKESSPTGLPIVNQRWEGKQDVFQEPGTYVVTYSVLDSAGNWSDPYSVTITVRPPNQPPVALFTTDKKEYKMGEKITITDLSTDDENAITKRDWENKKLAFFQPGDVTITLTVTDKHGATGTKSETIKITNELLYNEDDFNKIFTPYGDKYTVDGSQVPTMATIPLTSTSSPRLLIRANSPERVFQDGIVYQETGSGSTRILVHHVNETGRDVKMYVIATNNNITPANMNVENSGFAGPSEFATAAGKISIQRYFQSMQDGSKRSSTVLNPGESRVILQDLNAQKIKQKQVISLLSDLYTDQPIQYTVIVLDANTDPLTVLPTLAKLPKDGIHNRGTYANSDISLNYTEEVGKTAQRIVLGDNKVDPNLIGTDGLDGSSASNAGNFGVVYKVKLDHVAPYSLITFNPRGGEYSGYAMVNNQVVGIPTNGSVWAPNEMSVLYRTGHIEESVEMYFTAAAGSNLPVSVVVMPLPAIKN